MSLCILSGEARLPFPRHCSSWALRKAGYFGLRWNSDHSTGKNFTPPSLQRSHQLPSAHPQQSTPLISSTARKQSFTQLSPAPGQRQKFLSSPLESGQSRTIALFLWSAFPPFSQTLAAPVWILLLAFRRISAPCHTGWKRFLPQGTEQRLIKGAAGI